MTTTTFSPERLAEIERAAAIWPSFPCATNPEILALAQSYKAAHLPGLPDPSEGGIAELLDRTQRLERLLADPHPGLSTWSEAYIGALRGIARWVHPDDLRDVADTLETDAAREVTT